METSEIFKTRKEEIIEKTLEIMPAALAGDSANRSFYFIIDSKGNLTVDYLYYLGQQVLDDECFYTIRDYQIPSPNEFGYDSIEEMDFEACGYGVQIGNAIDSHIIDLENAEE